MVTSEVRDGVQWDNGCCALKLVKLAAGTFDAEHVLELPSWTTIASSSPPAGYAGKNADGLWLALSQQRQQQPPESHRSVRVFPGSDKPVRSGTPHTPIAADAHQHIGRNDTCGKKYLC